MKLANRYLESLLQNGLSLLWDKYHNLPDQVTTSAEFKQQLNSLMATSVASSLAPQSRDFGILVSDLRGFTPMTEQYPPLAIVELLNYYYGVMIRIIDGYGGVVDKFMGDSIMALFDSKDNARAAHHLLSCVIDMQLAMDDVNVFARKLGVPDIFMGIGMNYGSMVACELGSEIYREITVLGDQVNLASRLTAYCLRGQVLMSEHMYEMLQEEVILGSVNEVHVKGKAKRLTVYEVLGQRGDVLKLLPVRDHRKSNRVDVYLPVSYFLIEDEKVSPDPIQARIADISRHGMRLLSPQPHAFLDEVKVVIAFVSTGGSNDIYAKVMACKEEEPGTYSVSLEFTYLDEATSSAIELFVDHLL